MAGRGGGFCLNLLPRAVPRPMAPATVARTPMGSPTARMGPKVYWGLGAGAPEPERSALRSTRHDRKTWN